MLQLAIPITLNSTSGYNADHPHARSVIITSMHTPGVSRSDSQI